MMSCISLFKKNKYPKRLLPSVKKFQSFNYTPDCYVCRKSPVEATKMTDGKGNLQLYAIGAEKLLDFSMNLVNRKGVANSVKTNAEDVLIVPDEQYRYYTRKDWNNSNEDVPKGVTFTKDDKKGYFLLKIRDYHNFQTTFPFSKQNKPQKQYKFELKVVHSPNMINIVHFELHFYSNFIKEDEIRRVKGKITQKGYKNIIIHIIRNRIIQDKNIILKKTDL